MMSKKEWWDDGGGRRRDRRTGLEEEKAWLDAAEEEQRPRPDISHKRHKQPCNTIKVKRKQMKMILGISFKFYE